MKPHLKSVHGELVEVERNETPLQRARRRFGKDFAHVPGSTWRRSATPILTAWLAERQQQKDGK